MTPITYPLAGLVGVGLYLLVSAWLDYREEVGR